MWIDVALDHSSARNQRPRLWIAVDVLRATSVMTTFLAEGGNTLYLTADVEEARALQRQFNLLAMGEQGALPIPGFDFDNSPLALLRSKDRIQGNTTKAVDLAKQLLEKEGYEVLVFHATGTGGKVMEGLIEDGLVKANFDFTTTELPDYVAGGVMSAGPDRLMAAARYCCAQRYVRYECTKDQGSSEAARG